MLVGQILDLAARQPIYYLHKISSGIKMSSQYPVICKGSQKLGNFQYLTGNFSQCNSSDLSGEPRIFFT